MKLYALIICLLMAPTAMADMGEPRASYGATEPSFEVAVNVPSNVAIRYVFGSISLSPNALSAESVVWQLCGGSTVLTYASTPASSTDRIIPFAFAVTGNSCYEWTTQDAPGGVVAYSYIDILNESFESRSHANATWESQEHANATWCPLNECSGQPTCDPSCNFTGVIVGNITIRSEATGGNFTGNFSTMSGEVLGSAIPSSMAIPALIVFLTLMGVAVSFVSKTNPFPSLIGAIVQLVSLAFWYTQPDEMYLFNSTNLKTAFALMIILAFIGLSFRAYLMSQHSRNMYGDPE